MKNKYIFFFQYINKFPNACSVRGDYIINEFLKKNETNITVYNTNFSGILNGIEYKKLPININNSSSILKRTLSEVSIGFLLILRILKELIFNRKCKILLSSPSFIPVLLAGSILRKIGVRYFLDIRDLYPLVYFETGLIREGSYLGRILTHNEKQLYISAKHVFCATLGIQKTINKNNPNSTLVINGFPSNISQKNNEFKDSERLQIFHIGTLGRYQDVDLLYKIVTSDDLLHCDFTIIGKGSAEHKFTNLKRPNFTYISMLPHDEILKRLKSAHIGLSLRKANSLSKMALPVKDFEYAISGAYVIGTPSNEASAILEPLGISVSFEENMYVKIVQHINNFKSSKMVKLDTKKIHKYSREKQSVKVYNILAGR